MNLPDDYRASSAVRVPPRKKEKELRCCCLDAVDDAGATSRAVPWDSLRTEQERNACSQKKSSSSPLGPSHVRPAKTLDTGNTLTLLYLLDVACRNTDRDIGSQIWWPKQRPCTPLPRMGDQCDNRRRVELRAARLHRDDDLSRRSRTSFCRCLLLRYTS